MKHCFGIGNSSPAVVYQKLIEKGISDAIIVHQVGDLMRLKAKAPKGDLFFLTFEDLVRNLKVVNLSKYSDVNVYVFASPIRLNELEGITLLDVETSPGAVGFGFNLRHTPDYKVCRSASRKPGGKEVSVVNVNVLETLTNSIKKGSILTPLMTFVYSLPSATLQTPVKLAVAKILVENRPIKSLDKLLSSTTEYDLSSMSKARLIEILKSDVCKPYIEAFKHRAESKAKHLGATALAKKFGIDVFDVSYLLALVTPDKGTKNVKT